MSEQLPNAVCACPGLALDHRALDRDAAVGEDTGAIQTHLQPLHGLLCRKQGCAGRVIRRHNSAVDVLHAVLGSADDIEVTKEVPMSTHSDHRADLRVVKHHQSWYVDVTITCPATEAQVRRQSHLQQGVAAVQAAQRKMAKYAPVLGQQFRRGSMEQVRGFMPFVVETGGIVHSASRDWLDDLLRDQPTTLSRCYKVLHESLARHQGAMLAKYLQSLHG